MTDLARLASDIEFAKTIAETSTANLKDDGACNLDSTFFRLKKGERSGRLFWPLPEMAFTHLLGGG